MNTNSEALTEEARVKLHAIADAIEKEPKHYDQAEFCGTRRCIAGWGLLLFGDNIWKEWAEQTGNPIPLGSVVREFAKVIGITNDAAREIALGDWLHDWSKEGWRLSAKSAAKFLRHYADTGSFKPPADYVADNLEWSQMSTNRPLAAEQPPESYAEYLGGGLCAYWDGHHAVIQSEDGIRVLNRVFMDDNTLYSFRRWIERLEDSLEKKDG